MAASVPIGHGGSYLGIAAPQVNRQLRIGLLVLVHASGSCSGPHHPHLPAVTNAGMDITRKTLPMFDISHCIHMRHKRTEGPWLQKHTSSTGAGYLNVVKPL